MIEPISLNHKGELRRILTDKVYAEHMVNFDMSNLEEVLDRLSDGEYRYILFLLFKKRWVSIKKILHDKGLKNI